MLVFYKIVLNLAYLLGWPFFAIKSQKSNMWRQRRAINPDKYLPIDRAHDQIDKNKLIWLHASSVGEVKVLERLIKALNKTDRKFKYCVSTYTRTGQELARSLFPDAKAVFYFPLDCYIPLRRLFNNFKPDGIIIVETEIWPYFLNFCRDKDIPIILANGRLSEKSVKSYRKFKSPLADLFEIYKKFIVQTENDAQRMEEIGADSNKIFVGGNIKHDKNSFTEEGDSRKAIRETLSINNDYIFFIAASTRPGEEDQICRALKKVNCFPENMKVLIAPRHLERLDEVKDILNSNDFSFILYSELHERKQSPGEIILMDRMGVLADLFCGADIAFVGGTLVEIGGHNIMEPVLAGTPVLFGESLDNVREASEQILSNNWGAMIDSSESLAEALNQFENGELNFEKHISNDKSVADMTAEIIVREFGL